MESFFSSFESSPKDPKIYEILREVLNGEELNRRNALYLLKTSHPNDIFALFSAANELRVRYFENKVFAYGFIYFTTYCKNSCSFCYFRKLNSKCLRYRKTPEEIISQAEKLKESGVHLIDMTSGEDPLFFKPNYSGLLSALSTVKEATELPLMVSPGVVPKHVLRKIAEIAEWYALYQETHNRALFAKLRINQDYDERMKSKIFAKEMGLLIEEGILLGVGESEEDRINSFFTIKDIGADQVRVMGFVPQQGTPMEQNISPPILEEMKSIALLRLICPDKLIPASFDIDGLKGLQLRLLVGANVITSLIPKTSGLLGVAAANLGINQGIRSIQTIKPYLDSIGLKLASTHQYIEFIQQRKRLS
ncbi:methylornithine synthase PylB [Candidatus Borrarchaeum sp.]|uniref:methylornithine synthase PylB n=1 Tax=Candidatus Borrarchaeum sp. TaxID=2846742 RepID=UPI00257AE26A|nr:methylornithine synthase PylB [Candidatus Borrarchaeum sp.]